MNYHKEVTMKKILKKIWIETTIVMVALLIATISYQFFSHFVGDEMGMLFSIIPFALSLDILWNSRR